MISQIEMLKAEVADALSNLYDCDDGLDMLDNMSIYNKYKNQADSDPWQVVELASYEELVVFLNELSEALYELGQVQDDD